MLVLVVGLGIQLVPYGRAHANPPVTAEPAWPSADARALAVRACFDCHSNETRWPWYTNVAPVSWLIQQDVDRGRSVLNFSEWDRQQEEADDATDVVEDGEMPPARYLPLHPEANLTPAERQGLLRALEAIEEQAAREGGRGRNRGPGGPGDPRQQPASGATPATPLAPPGAPAAPSDPEDAEELDEAEAEDEGSGRGRGRGRGRGGSNSGSG